MPSLGADMVSAKVVEWLVEPGARVRRGDVLLVVETDKGAIEVEVFEDAVVEELVAPLDVELPVGAVLARLRPLAGEAAPAPLPPLEPVSPQPVSAEQPAPAAPPVPRAPPAAAPGTVTWVRASPAARRRAAQLGVPLAELTGSGPGGAILLADVPPGSSARQAAVPRQKRSGFDSAAMRRAIAAAMARSKREIPHYYLTQTLSMDAALRRLNVANQARGVAERLLPAALFLRAIGLALARVPGFNGFCEDGVYRAGAGIHVGWAVALRGGGLVAPAVHDADRRSLDELMAALRDVVARARGGGLRSSELTDATVTVTSLGERGAEVVLPIILPPQVAMIGVGNIVERPWSCNGGLGLKPVVTLTLAADHRVSDGHQGGRLLAEVERLLTQPEEL